MRPKLDKSKRLSLDTEERELTEREQRFVGEYLIKPSAYRAAELAGFSGYDGNYLLQQPHIKAAIRDSLQFRAGRTEIHADQVLQHIAAVAFADPGDIAPIYQVNCRYCWGDNNMYQRTPAEMAKAEETWRKQQAMRRRNGVFETIFDPQGGEGFDPWAAPNPNCPECSGHGFNRGIITDYRKLDRMQRAQIASIKITGQGENQIIEIKFHNKIPALRMLGETLAMFAEKKQIPSFNPGMPDDELRAAVDGLRPIVEKIIENGSHLKLIEKVK